MDKKTKQPWDENKYWTYPGSGEVIDFVGGGKLSVENFKFQRDGDMVFLGWRNHSDEYSEERAKFLNKLVADGWKFVSILSEIPDNYCHSVLTIVVTR
jgi:hypothetical protein